MKKITIALAIYKPNPGWLAQQLTSLNEQTYPNIELFIMDDCPEEPVSMKLLTNHLTNIPFHYHQNEQNLGSTKTFEKLTKLADGDYIAYCDQDDIWEKDKLTILVNELEKTSALLVFSDVTIIDRNDAMIADSMKKLRKQHHFYSGSDLANKLLVKNFVTGCTMLIRSDIAKAAIPFPDEMIHDHYLALCCAISGNIHFVNLPLVRYRQHNHNQTGILNKVFDKATYLNEHILPFDHTLAMLQQRFQTNTKLVDYLVSLRVWLKHRTIWWQKYDQESLQYLWRNRHLNLPTTYFELILARLPKPCFDLALYMIKKSWI